MPTITIETAALAVPQRRRIALQLTRWFKDHGVAPDHVVVRFATVEPGSTFVVGSPVEASNPDGPAAVVSCCVATDRSSEFLSGLATAISDALTAAVGAGWCQIQFIPTAAAHVHLRHDGRMIPVPDLPKGRP